MSSVGHLLRSALDLYTWVIIARCLLSFFPAIDWWQPPFVWIRNLTDPVMDPFRRAIPPIGGLDFSPLVVLFALSLLKSVVSAL
jgi:YggT family protein